MKWSCLHMAAHHRCQDLTRSSSLCLLLRVGKGGCDKAWPARRGVVIKSMLAVLTSGACLRSHPKSQLHPDPSVDRVLTVAERKRLQSIPDDVPLKV